MVLYQILFKLEPFYERSVPPESKHPIARRPQAHGHATLSELLKMLAMSGSDDQIIRPSFPNQQSAVPQDKEDSYNLQLLSAIEACWLEIPEMRPNIKRMRTLINANLRSM